MAEPLRLANLPGPVVVHCEDAKTRKSASGVLRGERAVWSGSFDVIQYNASMISRISLKNFKLQALVGLVLLLAIGAITSANPSQSDPNSRSREELIKNALASVGRVQGEIAKLRALPFLGNIAAEYQTQEEFRKFVQSEIRVDLPREKGDALGRAAHHIGLLKERIDLVSTLEDAQVSQAGAYYDPQTKKFYIVMVPKSPMLLDTISAHELTHALQDQHFDLTAYIGGRGNTQGLSEDELQARRFIVEGEATLTMMAYQTQVSTKFNILDPNVATQTRMALAQAAGFKISQLTEMQKQQSNVFSDIGDDIKKAMEAIDKIPPYILIPLFEAYFKGAVPVFETYARGGWPAVTELYKTPPESTEQVLHPVEKLVGARDYPVGLTLPSPGKALDGWNEIYSDMIGELIWRVYFSLWNQANPDAVASGWDGDRYAVYAAGDKTLALISTIWDSPEDATRFANAYVATLGVRFPGASPVAGEGWKGVSRPEGTVVVLEHQRNRVNIVDGCAKDLAPFLLSELHKTRLRRHPQDR
jgi:hypothetical protein